MKCTIAVQHSLAAESIMALERELETYRTKLPSLLKDRGKFVLIHGEDVDSVWDTIEAAITAGYDRFGLEPFLVKEIQEVEVPKYFSREIRQCPT